MPSEYSPASTEQRARYPDIKDEFGEDPARWLDHPLLDRPGLRDMARIRVYSIDDIDLARQWIEVERDLDRGPRKKVVSWLNERIATLQVIGERPDRLEERDGRDVPDTLWSLNGDSWSETDRSVGISSQSRELAVATDGGESDAE